MGGSSGCYLFFVVASVATCPPKLNERRRKQSTPPQAAKWIASSLQRKIAFAILSRTPLRKRVAFVAGNDAENACLGFEAVIPERSAGPSPE
jgi:hypothetical protein